MNKNDFKNTLSVPPGKLANSESEAVRKRKKIREQLLKGKEVKVASSGTVHAEKDSVPGNENTLSVPPGKLASFYWYERDPALFGEERATMQHFFPQFQLDKLEGDGRLYWYGEIQTDLRPEGRWYLQIIYDNNHPHNDSYGGSVKIYAIEPDLKEVQSQLGESIPHLLRDSDGEVYLCTARKEDVEAGAVVTSAATSLSWAVKWISAFELWMAGDLSTSEFAGHSI